MDDEPCCNPVTGWNYEEVMKAYEESKRPRVRICVEGFDTSLPEDDSKKALINHFNSCGKIIIFYFEDRCAFMVIRGEDAEEKALALNGSDVGGWNVSVKVSPVVYKKSLTPQQRDAMQCNDPRFMHYITVTGYDTSVSDDDLKITLRKHFGSCGEIIHMYIPRTYDG
ncbi:nucleolin 1-like [Eutrema salsugineum]|uniref:nucleolin 1-like n=1 Tax=Eutrema salsugineum TaxID=72664 RepID=UPI000CED3766|nr:nucleolin 1-like [Eutrema salsugineum]